MSKKAFQGLTIILPDPEVAWMTITALFQISQQAVSESFTPMRVNPTVRLRCGHRELAPIVGGEDDWYITFDDQKCVSVYYRPSKGITGTEPQIQTMRARTFDSTVPGPLEFRISSWSECPRHSRSKRWETAEQIIADSLFFTK